MIGAGVLGLVVALSDIGLQIATGIVGSPPPAWYIADVSQGWLVCQAMLTILGGFGGLFGAFSVTTVGLIAGLCFVTPVGLVTSVPSLLMLIAAVARLRSFHEFKPRWRGKGPRPPGP